MSKRDYLNGCALATGGVATLSGVTPFESNIVDAKHCLGLTASLITGTVTDAGTASGFTMKLQESDTTADGDFTDVAAVDMVNGTQTLTVTADGDDDIGVGMLGYLGTSRYVRAVVTGTTNTNATVAVVFHRFGLSMAPPAAVDAEIAAT